MAPPRLAYYPAHLHRVPGHRRPRGAARPTVPRAGSPSSVASVAAELKARGHKVEPGIAQQ
eukprot:9368488-Alexandrium_andersonii.AAC.1